MAYESGRWMAIIPVKSMNQAKSRLGREDLAWPFLRDCVHALQSSESIDHVVITTSDIDVTSWAIESGCTVIDDYGHEGINSAVAHAAQQARAGRTDAKVMVIVSDLPSLTPSSVDGVLHAASAHPVSFLADAEGVGTTIWCSQASDPVTTYFGLNSRAAHRAHGAVDLVTVGDQLWADSIANARRDVDTPEALAAAVGLGVGAATSAALD